MNTASSLIFCHGFGLSPSFWQHLLPCFRDYRCHLLMDNGPCSQTQLIEQQLLSQPNEVIAIGHSLGFLKLSRYLSQLKCLVGLNAFRNFLGYQPRLCRIRQRAYRQFGQDLLSNSQNTLEDFYRRCGLPADYHPSSSLDPKVLEQDLALLGTDAGTIANDKVVIINAIDDPIVPHQLTKDNFGQTQVQQYLLPYGKHTLGFLHPQTIANLILDFIK